MSRPPLPTGPLGRILTAMVTPFGADGALDLDAAQRVASHLVDLGNDGLVVAGTTGESPTLTVTENADLLRAVVDAVGERATVVAGVGTNSTAHSIELAEQAAKAGADGTLIVTPYYSKPTQEGVLAHFRAVTAAADLPVMLYDIPGRTGIAIARETYLRVAEDDRVVAVKDAVGDIPRGVALMAETGLALYSGDDVLNLAWLAHGACGVVSVVGHVAAGEYAAMAAALDAGDLAAAQDIYLRLAPVVEVVMGRVQGAMTAKAALQLAGVLDNRTMRLPLVPAADDLVADLHQALVTAGMLTGDTR